jgi:hypothetical protein
MIYCSADIKNEWHCTTTTLCLKGICIDSFTCTFMMMCIGESAVHHTVCWGWSHCNHFTQFTASVEKRNLVKKQFHYGPWQALRGPGGWGSQILRQSAHEGGKVVSPTHWPPLPPENIPSTHFCQRLIWPHSHSVAGRIMSMKNSIDIIGNRFCDLPVCSAVSQPLRHCVPQRNVVVPEIFITSKSKVREAC